MAQINISHGNPKNIIDMKNKLFIFLLILSSCNLISKKESKTNIVQNKKEWIVSKTTGSIISFRDGSKIDTKIQDMKYIFTLSNSKENPFFVLSGRLNKMNDENISIFIFSLDDTLKNSAQIRRYSYPGKEFDYESNKINFESKLLYSNNLDEMVWIQSTRIDSSKFDTALFILTVNTNVLKEKKIPKKASLEFNSIISRIKDFAEIEGQDITSEP